MLGKLFDVDFNLAIHTQSGQRLRIEQFASSWFFSVEAANSYVVCLLFVFGLIFASVLG